MLRDFEVRGLGILNIRHIFGETSIRPKNPATHYQFGRGGRRVYEAARPVEHPHRNRIHPQRQRPFGYAARRRRTQPCRLVEAAVRSTFAVARQRQYARILERHQTQLKENEQNHENRPD